MADTTRGRTRDDMAGRTARTAQDVETVPWHDAIDPGTGQGTDITRE